MLTSLKKAARTRQVRVTPSVTNEGQWFAAADGFHVSERACAGVSRKPTSNLRLTSERLVESAVE